MEDRLEEELRRAPQGTREALLAFKQTGETEQLETFARGIIARNIDDSFQEVLEKADDNTRMIDDLGIDSLTMVEIAITLEDALDIELVDEELKELATLGDIRNHLVKLIEAKPQPERLSSSE